jgi:hypothetical protein
VSKVIEIRSYELKPGVRQEFDRLVATVAVPILHRWRVDVVAFGPSLHDQDSYYLIRCYETLQARQESQAAFYGSQEWIDGPRASLVGLIERYISVVVEMDDRTIEGLRRLRGATAPSP